MSGPDPAREEADKAAAEAAAIGGRPGNDLESVDGPVSQPERPLVEAGEGEAEGFEQAEQALIEHSSHGDEHAARQAIEDAPAERDDPRAVESGEADAERSSEREENLP